MLNSTPPTPQSQQPDQQKIAAAKKAVQNYIDVMMKLTAEEKKILNQALTDTENSNINQVRQQIMEIK